MNAIRAVFCTALIIGLMQTCLNSFPIDNTSTHATPPSKTTLPVRNFFDYEKFYVNNATIITNPLHLQQVAKDTLHYIESHKKTRASIVNPPAFAPLISLDDVIRTLKFVIATVEQDKRTGHQRIVDPTFVQKNFSCVAWNADRKNAQKHNIELPKDGRVRLTSYVIFTVKGNHQKTANYPCALYALNNNAIRTKFTKHQILAGVLEKSAYRSSCIPLAWVSRQNLEDALIQGTVLVKFPNGTSKIFKVHTHNNILYDKNQKNTLAQERYWFFKEIKGSSHLKGNIATRFKQRAEVIFAGDLVHIGIGKLIAITHINPITNKREMRLGVLADTGGAFLNNLYQLDLFGGIVSSHEQFSTFLKQLPSTTKACVVYKI